LGLTVAIRSVPTQPLSVLITYGAPDATSVNFALLAHAELTKSCEAPRIKQYYDGVLIEEEHTRKNFLSHGYLLHSGVVGAAKMLHWDSLLALLLGSHRRWSTR
jgi:hypothetical protein